VPKRAPQMWDQALALWSIYLKGVPSQGACFSSIVVDEIHNYIHCTTMEEL
jgi:hypothetical protein